MMQGSFYFVLILLNENTYHCFQKKKPLMNDACFISGSGYLHDAQVYTCQNGLCGPRGEHMPFVWHCKVIIVARIMLLICSIYLMEHI